MTKNALEMINDIDDKIILSALEKPEKKKNILKIRKLRWVAVAAIITILTAVPVAAEVFGLKIDFNPETNTWNADANGRFAVKEYSKEIQNITGSKMFIQNSLEEAEEFLGIDFPKNVVLEEATKHYVYTDFADGVAEDGAVHCNTYVIENEGNLLGTYTIINYLVEKIPVEIIYSTVCEENPYENGGGFSVSFENETIKESYINYFGREFEIITEKDDYGNCCCYAFSDCDGILITISGNSHIEGKAKAIVYKVIDAYK